MCFAPGVEAHVGGVTPVTATRQQEEESQSACEKTEGGATGETVWLPLCY